MTHDRLKLVARGPFGETRHKLRERLTHGLAGQDVEADHDEHRGPR